MINYILFINRHPFFMSKMLQQCVYVPKPFMSRMQHKVIFLSGAQLVWIQSFPFYRPVSTRVIDPSLPYNLFIRFITFPIVISTMRNANSLVEDVNTDPSSFTMMIIVMPWWCTIVLCCLFSGLCNVHLFFLKVYKLSLFSCHQISSQTLLLHIIIIMSCY